MMRPSIPSFPVVLGLLAGADWTVPVGGRVRYTMELTPDGSWFEEGMYSADGGDWAKFFEMRLRKP